MSLASTISLITKSVFYLVSYTVAAKIYQDPTTKVNRFTIISDGHPMVVGILWALFYYLIHL